MEKFRWLLCLILNFTHPHNCNWSFTSSIQLHFQSDVWLCETEYAIVNSTWPPGFCCTIVVEIISKALYITWPLPWHKLLWLEVCLIGFGNMSYLPDFLQECVPHLKRFFCIFNALEAQPLTNSASKSYYTELSPNPTVVTVNSTSCKICRSWMVLRPMIMQYTKCYLWDQQLYYPFVLGEYFQKFRVSHFIVNTSHPFVQSLCQVIVSRVHHYCLHCAVTLWDMSQSCALMLMHPFIQYNWKFAHSLSFLALSVCLHHMICITQRFYSVWIWAKIL